MDPNEIGLFRLAEQRLTWVDQRQRLLAQNVANASTPGFQPRDLSSFAATLAGQGASLSHTSPAHLDGPGSQAASFRARPIERAPDGNAVSLADQLSKVADTAGTHELVTNLYHKYLGLFRTALGRAG